MEIGNAAKDFAFPLGIRAGRDHPESVQLCLWKWDCDFDVPPEVKGSWNYLSDLTVNLPGGYGLKPQEAFISGDFTRDKLAFIRKEQAGKSLPGQARSGFATYTPVAFDLSRLAQYDREGVEEFCRQWGLDIPKERKKSKGNRQEERKEKERDRSIWK